MPPTQAIYLHGFASSPRSKKAVFFRDRLAGVGIDLRVPDLNQPDFAHLTMTAMIERVRQELAACPPDEPVVLFGSSMGGGVAVHALDRLAAAEAGRVSALVLMAPAFDFVGNRRRTLGEAGLQQWRERGWWETPNYATGQPERIHYGLMDDLAGYPIEGVVVNRPTLLFHGVHDTSVPVEQSRAFAAERPLVTLRELDSDHELLDVLETLWRETVEFLGL